MAIETNQIIQGDCIEILSRDGFPAADLVFADPPFNIGFQYDVYEDKKAYDDYYEWTRRWMRGCRDILTDTGSMWVAIGDDYAAEVRMIGRELGLHLRNWVIWHYTFGQATKAKFARSHTHLFYWTKAAKDFTFNDQAARIPSDRQIEYNDKRASSRGKMPDDVWSEFSRLCGSFAEREGWHPCQMPESILGRIIRVSSNVGDLVVDPFGGSGTTLVAAKKLGRQYLGTELSEDYAQRIGERLASVVVGQPVNGDDWPDDHVACLRSMYAEASVSTELLGKRAALLNTFTTQFNWRIEASGWTGEYQADDVLGKLTELRKRAGLPRIKVHVKDGNAGPGSRASDAKSKKTAKPEKRKSPQPRVSGAGCEPSLFGADDD